MSDNLKVVFMGTPDFAVPSLRAINEKYGVQAVFCQPDKAVGRGNKIKFCPVKEYALQNNIPVHQPETFKNYACLEILEEYKPDIIVVAAYGKILPTYVLDYCKYGCINIHGSLLPKYRGASPIQYAVLNGDAKSGITIMKMGEGLDTGDIILQSEIDIAEYETSGELFDRMSNLSVKTVLEAIDLIISGNATYTKQDDSLASHVSMITKEMATLDFTKSSNEIIRLIYGMNPWPSAYFLTTDGPFKIHKAIYGNDTDFEPSKIISLSKLGIEVACGDGKSIIITELQKPGKKKMDAHSFILGSKIIVGDSIYSV